MVRLLLLLEHVIPSTPTSFNPTMVRLLPVLRVSKGSGSVLFQSHNGAIAAQSSCRDAESLQRVSIPQWCDCCSDISAILRFPIRCFNPTMVRLLPFVANLAYSALSGFNPTMVRLLPKPPSAKETLNELV